MKGLCSEVKMEDYTALAKNYPMPPAHRHRAGRDRTAWLPGPNANRPGVFPGLSVPILGTIDEEKIREHISLVIESPVGSGP